MVDGEIVLNPTRVQKANNHLNLTVAGTLEKIVMIEAGADEVPDDVMLEAIKTGHAEIKKMVEFINGIKAEIGNTRQDKDQERSGTSHSDHPPKREQRRAKARAPFLFFYKFFFSFLENSGKENCI